MGFEEFIETKRPDNRKQFIYDDGYETITVGAFNRHIFILDLQFDMFYKEAKVIYRQSIDDSKVLIKTFNNTKDELEIIQKAADSTTITMSLEDEAYEQGLRYIGGNPKRLSTERYPLKVNTYIISTITTEESKLFKQDFDCYAQLRLVDLDGKVSYSEKMKIKVFEALDIPTDEQLLDD